VLGVLWLRSVVQSWLLLSRLYLLLLLLLLLLPLLLRWYRWDHCGAQLVHHISCQQASQRISGTLSLQECCVRGGAGAKVIQHLSCCSGGPKRGAVGSRAVAGMPVLQQHQQRPLHRGPLLPLSLGFQQIDELAELITAEGL
jgi:hypothetical protein